MRKMILGFVLVFFLSTCAFAAYGNYDSWKFAREYESELRATQSSPGESAGAWKVEADIRAGIASYKEEAHDGSDWENLYYEGWIQMSRETENEIELAIGGYFGLSPDDTERWYEGGTQTQNNDMKFFRAGGFGTIGKILHSDYLANNRVIPFIGYGYRYVEFERSNFLDLTDLSTWDAVITEKYYIHYANAGVKFDTWLGERFNIALLGSIGYAFYNQMDNSALGKVDGHGGYIIDGRVNLTYKLNDYWQLICGGFADFENLEGGSRPEGDLLVVWPDNKLDIYGMNLGARLVF